MKENLRKTAQGVLLIFIGGVFFFHVWVSDRRAVPILMYHNVERIDEYQPNWVSPNVFKQHMDFLKRHHYNVISLDELVEGIKLSRAFDSRTVVITFDDGHENNYTNAFPILKEYNFPATIFMPSDKVGLPGRLTIAQIKEMMASGINIGSHTRTEAYLPFSEGEERRNEIFGSKEFLEDALDVPVTTFAYPIGGFNDTVKELVKEAGYKAACTTNRGYDRYNKDLFELNRVRLSDKDTEKIYLIVKFSGYYNIFRKLKSPS